MPYKTGKLKGQLTTTEIRKLVRAHNKLTDIKIPKGATREDIIKLIEKNGYSVNHEKQALVPRVQMQRKKTIKLDKAIEITKPKPLTEEQKKKRQQAKQKKEGEKAFLKKVIPAPPKPSKPSKGIKVGKPPPKPKKEAPKKEEPNKKEIDKLSIQYINEIKKMKPLKTLSQIQATYKKYEKKIYDYIGRDVDNYEELREYWDDKWSDPVSDAIPDGRKKAEPKKEAPKPRRKLKGRLTGVREKTTEEIEKLYPEFYAEDRNLTMKTRGYIYDVLSVYHKIKSIGTTEQKKEARKIFDNFNGYRGTDKEKFNSYKHQFEMILKKEAPKPEHKLYEKEYNEFLKMFNEAIEKRSRQPFLRLRDRILRFTEPILVGTPSFKVQDGARLKALNEPFMKKINDILEKTDTQIKKYVEIGKKAVGGQKTHPKQIKMTQKPTMNTKKIVPKKKAEPKKAEPKKAEPKIITDKDFIKRPLFVKFLKNELDLNNAVIKYEKQRISGKISSDKAASLIDKKMLKTKYKKQSIIDHAKKDPLVFVSGNLTDRARKLMMSLLKKTDDEGYRLAKKKALKKK